MLKESTAEDALRQFIELDNKLELSVRQHLKHVDSVEVELCRGAQILYRHIVKEDEADTVFKFLLTLLQGGAI